MFGCECFYWDSVPEFYSSEPESFSLPAPLPEWPQGGGFASGRIFIGELEVLKISKCERIWSLTRLRSKSQGLSFYRPVEIPDDFYCLDHYCQSNGHPLRGYVLVARKATSPAPQADRVHGSVSESPSLKRPLNYSLIWSNDSLHDGRGFFWLPNPPVGYKAMGVVVTSEPDEPDVEEVKCMRAHKPTQKFHRERSMFRVPLFQI